MARSRFWGFTSRMLMSVVAGLLVLSYVSVVINPAKAWFFTLAGIFFVPLSTLNLCLLIWAVKRRSRSFVIPLLALVPAFFFVGRYIQVGQDEESVSVDSQPTLKVMSYNVGRFVHRSEKSGIESRKECVDSVFDFIRNQDADIICLQEFYISDINAVRSHLRKNMPGYKAEYFLFPSKKGAFGNVTLSRYPVKDKGVVKFDKSANLAIYTDYQVEGRHFRVYNCHFESYNISFSGLVKALAQRDRDVFAETGTKIVNSISRRPKQVDKVFRHIESCPVESFVCGDFNDNPMSYTYYRMNKGRKDSFIEAGEGFGATYSFMWPMLRLDYVLVPERFDAQEYLSPRVGYSDHYPVITEIIL